MKRFIRVWQEFDLEDVEKHLIVAGDLSAECFRCHKIGLELRAKACPECSAFFKYMGFRRKVRPEYLRQVKEELPRIILIDFDDFKKSLGNRDARKLLDL